MADQKDSPFCVLVFVGPGELELSRLQRLCESVLKYEPNLRRIVLVDDGSGNDFNDVLKPAVLEKIKILPNPRNRTGNWWKGGLCVALATGLGWIAENETVDFTVRLDTDSHVFGPFFSKISNEFKQRPEIGALGTWKTYPMQSSDRLPHPGTTDFMKFVVPKLTHKLTFWRETNVPTYYQCAAFKKDRTVAKLARLAMQNGYQFGDFVQGGGYAISHRALRKAASLGLFDQPMAYLRLKFGEDHLATLITYASGFKLADFNDPEQVFAVQGVGLPAAPDVLLESGYSIGHSIKNDPNFTEEEICAALP